MRAEGAAMAAEQRLKRRIGLGLLTLYGVGVMVGAGIYVLVGAVAGAAGAWAPAAFLLAGVVAAFSAASFGELAGRLPESAGEAAYARAAFGSDALALAVGLTVALVGVVSAAAVLKGGVGYLRALAPAPEPALIVGLAALIALAAIWGVVESLAAAAALTLIEVLGLAAVIAVAALAGPPEPAAAFPSAAAAAP
ncbi:MAG: amino acid permease, partial [Pseudomonadota bacterium]